MLFALSGSQTVRSRIIVILVVTAVLLATGFIASVLQSARVMTIYERMASYQLLASGIYIKLSDTAAALEDRLRTRSPENVARYSKTYAQLLRDTFEYEDISRDRAAFRAVVDFRFMVQTYVEAANAAVAYSSDGDITRSNQSYLEARRVQQLINDYLPRIFEVQASDVSRMAEQARMERRRSLILSAIVTVVILSVSVVVVFQISVGITRPTAKLVAAAGQVAIGNWDYRVETIEAKNEMRLLGVAFNDMLDKIQAQMDQLRQERLDDQVQFNEKLDEQRTEALLKSAQLKALQARINPHFVFNTLNTITQSAYLENSRKTAEITEAFASLMRFNLEHFDGVVTLEQEFANLGDYTFLQRIRSEGRIAIDAAMEEELAHEFVPGLIIQPLVENSIQHGMGELGRTGEISVTATSSGDHYTLTVEDNGLGMTPEALSQARGFAVGNFKGEYGDHIGVRSVFERLHLYSNDLADIRVDSKRGLGTTIQMTLPRGLGQ